MKEPRAKREEGKRRGGKEVEKNERHLEWTDASARSSTHRILVSRSLFFEGHLVGTARLLGERGKAGK